jgi:hypothetical protein
MAIWSGRRTEPRVDFHEPVRVMWPGEVSGVVGRAVNLSTSGILIDAPTPSSLPVGSNILCDLGLPRGPRVLRGRVAHRRTLSPQNVGMGIEFIDLSERESAELRTIVGERDEKPQRVKVNFEGTNQVVRARAFATEGGFQLTTALPFLKMHTKVDIALSPDALVTAKGTVVGVALDRSHADGIPRLLIDVSLTPSEEQATPVVEAVLQGAWGPGAPDQVHAGEGEVHASEINEGEISAGEVPEGGINTGEVYESATTREAAPYSYLRARVDLHDERDTTEVVSPSPLPTRQRLKMTLAGAAVGVLVVAAALGLMLRGSVRTTSQAPEPVTAEQAPPVAPAAAEQVAAPEPTVAAEPTPVAAAPAPVAAPPTPKPVAAPTVAAAPTPPKPVAATLPKAAARPRPAPPVVVAAAEAPEAAEAESTDKATDDPTDEGSAEVTDPPVSKSGTFTVALEGSVKDAVRYPLRAPDGVAFNLPHARTPLKLGTYRPRVTGLRGVWIRPLAGGGINLRFFTTAAAKRGLRIDLDAEGVHVIPPAR